MYLSKYDNSIILIMLSKICKKNFFLQLGQQLTQNLMTSDNHFLIFKTRDIIDCFQIFLELLRHMIHLFVL